MSVEKELIDLGAEKFAELSFAEKMAWFLKVNEEKVEQFNHILKTTEDPVKAIEAAALFGYSTLCVNFLTSALEIETKRS